MVSSFFSSKKLGILVIVLYRFCISLQVAVIKQKHQTTLADQYNKNPIDSGHNEIFLDKNNPTSNSIVNIKPYVSAFNDKNTMDLIYSEQIKYDAPDDCRFSISSGRVTTDYEVALLCNLRTVNSDFDTTNFSVIPSEYTVSLVILCNNTIMARSKLEAKSFTHLHRLRELSMEHCKINRLGKQDLSGLRNLRNLTIRTHNVNWPALHLEIEQNSFSDCRRLEQLDLSLNNIWSLPENLFCTATDLRLLNLSSNRLQDINDLCFGDGHDMVGDNYQITKTAQYNSTYLTKTKLITPCTLDLEILDLSHNNYILLPANGLSLLKRLKCLKMHNNAISMVDDRSLGGLRYLQIFDLSSNKIVALPSGLFSDVANSIQELYLQNNSITLLTPKLFTNLEYLQALDLSNNKISSTFIDRQTFAGLIRLVLLNLAHNRITKLEPDIFFDLYTLQILNLRYNRLQSIAADTFAPMNNLHTLLLSYNKIKYLDAYSLNGLYVLSLLSIDNNALTGIHPEALRNCSSLQDLNLNGNELKYIPLSLRNMRLLRTIDLGENVITMLNDSAFRGMTNLYGLRLIGNRIENISRSVFKDLPNLQILNLARNRISFIESGTFEISSSLQAIRLDGNLLNDINGLFGHMPNLLWLNISDNRLQHFDYSHIPSELHWLDLHKNELIELSNDYSVGVTDGTGLHTKLQTLDASFNRLSKVTPASIPDSIELLFLNDNLINLIEPHTFIDKKRLLRVDLYANQITTLDIKSLRLSPLTTGITLPEFYIGGNPFICDCNIEWLQKINQMTSRQYPRIMDLQTIYCKLLNNRERSYISLSDAEPGNFLCSYKTHCFALCHCCDFIACDCQMTCPLNCTCFNDQSWSINVVECSGSGYTEIPANIPMDTTELFIDGNDLGELSGHSFIGRKNLVVLFANNSNIFIIYNTTFHGLRKLTVLHLENNKIKRFFGFEFGTLENLRELFLQNNQLWFIDNQTFVELRKLEVLRLDNNKLIIFDVWQLISNPYLVEIGLAGNMWSCDCTYLGELLKYVHRNVDKIIDSNHITCVLRENRIYNGGNECTFKEYNGISTIVQTKELNNLLPVVLVGTCAVIGVFAILLGLFCYRHALKYWVNQHCLPAICLKTAGFVNRSDKDIFNDAYIIYSLQDEDFVSQVLTTTLETDVGYRLCLHYRDFHVNTYVTDTILEASENSKRTIIVLSRNFLYNEWPKLEFKSAFNDIIKCKRKVVIFILYGDIPKRYIDADMRFYLRSTTCIEWNDKKFWQKLRIALPHMKRNNNCVAQRLAVYQANPTNYSTSINMNVSATSASLRPFDSNSNNYATINDFHKLNHPQNKPSTNSVKNQSISSICSGNYNHMDENIISMENNNSPPYNLHVNQCTRHHNNQPESVHNVVRSHSQSIINTLPLQQSDRHCLHEYAIPNYCLDDSFSNSNDSSYTNCRNISQIEMEKLESSLEYPHNHGLLNKFEKSNLEKYTDNSLNRHITSVSQIKDCDRGDESTYYDNSLESESTSSINNSRDCLNNYTDSSILRDNIQQTRLSTITQKESNVLCDTMNNFCINDGRDDINNVESSSIEIENSTINRTVTVCNLDNKRLPQILWT